MKLTRPTFRLRSSSVLFLAVAALVLAMAGSATAALMVGSENIKKNAVASKHLKKQAVKAKHVKSGAIKAKHLAPEVRKGLAGPAGQKGESGAQGAQGIAGPSGASGYQVVTSAAKNINAGSWGAQIVWCPTGKVAIGGGVSPSSINAVVTSNYPIIHDDADPGPGYAAPNAGSADGWHGGATNNGTSATQLRTFAICMNAN